jgi:hypothetical protein
VEQCIKNQQRRVWALGAPVDHPRRNLFRRQDADRTAGVVSIYALIVSLFEYHETPGRMSGNRCHYRGAHLEIFLIVGAAACMLVLMWEGCRIPDEMVSKRGYAYR